MSMQVLQTRSQVTTARKELIARNVSRLESPLLAAIKRSVRHFGIRRPSATS
jgi:hypothetical protein